MEIQEPFQRRSHPNRVRESSLGIILFLTVFSSAFLSLILLYSKHYLILGSEGNYFLDIPMASRIFGFTWAPLNGGTGSPNPLIHMFFPVSAFYSAFESLGLSAKLTNVFGIFWVYVLPVFSMCWLLHCVLNVNLIITILVSLFYILNPISTYHLQELMFWNDAPMFVWPLAFGAILKYYREKARLFVVMGGLSLFLAFTFANLPYFIIYHMLLLISAVVASYYYKNKLDYKLALTNFIILELSFLLFSLWWLAPLLKYAFGYANKHALIQYIIDWVVFYSSHDPSIVKRIFSFATLTPPVPATLAGRYYFPDFYNQWYINPFLFIPFFLFVYNLIQVPSRKYKHMFILAIFMLIIFFLSKGANPPFGGIYIWIIKNVPLFYVFRSPTEKFSLFFVFLFSVVLGLLWSVNGDAKKRYLMGVYLLVCAVPYFSLNFTPPYKIHDDNYVSNQFIDKAEYKEVRKMMNSEKLDYRYLSLPGSINYQVTMWNHDNKYYRGMDPIVYSIKKSFIAAYSEEFYPKQFGAIFDNLSNTSLQKVLSLYNVRRVLVNEDIYPSFSFRESLSPKQEEEKLSSIMREWKLRSMHLYTNNDFLPHFYIPQKIIVADQNPKDLARVVSRPDYQLRSAIFFLSDNLDKSDDLVSVQKYSSSSPSSSGVGQDKGKEPILEFRRINPTKYKIFVHQAGGVFPLVFLESFSRDWKIYSVPWTKTADIGVGRVEDYQVSPVNQEDQASLAEIKAYWEKGWITVLHDSQRARRTGFISRNFQGTIQNDNLPIGPVYETWFKSPLPEKEHLIVNGYANSWTINTGALCANNPACVRNLNGTYDLSMIVEFCPQRLYYLGLAIAAITALISVWVVARAHLLQP